MTPDTPEAEPDADIAALWRDQTEETKTMTLDFIHSQALRLHARKTRETVIIAICVLLILMASGYVIAVFPNGTLRLGYALTALASLFIFYFNYTHRMTDQKAMAAPSQACADFYRRMLIS